MTMRDWAAGKLREDGYPTVTPVGVHGLQINRKALPPAFVYCVEKKGNLSFTARDLDDAIREMPTAEAFLLIRRSADGSAYEMAETRGVLLARMGDLKGALLRSPRISEYVSSEQQYVHNRLNSNWHVANTRRCGEFTYEVSRKGGLSPLVAIFYSDYELTSDSVYSLLAAEPRVPVDAIVNTNPSCRGFASEVYEAGKVSNTKILLLTDFLKSLGLEWK
ncbi:hypothetical protein FB565_005065 [Actinoplanes lutulentus]|uniref:Uncharacterized protein n=1 Tax=Actinoplanes lutulentus TaxID=1287878 RepID=A0A327ZI64_9ACTN|nr:hypothetical protein [Actinoplanes lutulentus]MBB2945332.1 hypothetical protein [Actinoplanes lutulentus]RAK40533.1 hypothetical protein B0I29_103571 [Actinoplanes lutulentus]